MLFRWDVNSALPRVRRAREVGCVDQVGRLIAEALAGTARAYPSAVNFAGAKATTNSVQLARVDLPRREAGEEIRDGVARLGT